MNLLLKAYLLISVASAAAADVGKMVAPGPLFNPPDRHISYDADAPRIDAHHRHAAPDQTFLLIGENLTGEVVLWGSCALNPAGAEVLPDVHFAAGQYLAATVPQRSYDGIFVGWARNRTGWSRPFVLNAPEIWGATPDQAAPGEEFSLFGEGLARRPDFDRSHVYFRRDGDATEPVALEVTNSDRHMLRVRVPYGAEASKGEIFVHTGVGGQYGWSLPVSFTVMAPREQPREFNVTAATEVALRRAIDEASQAGGGVVQLPPQPIEVSSTLAIPAGVVLRGAGRERSIIRFIPHLPEQYEWFSRGRWDDANRKWLMPKYKWNSSSGLKSSWSGHPSVNKGQVIVYSVEAPQNGKYDLWLRYAAAAYPWQQPGVSGRFGISVNGGEIVRLHNLPNTGGYAWFNWRRVAEVQLKAGNNRLEWHNIEGGGIAYDAMVFSMDPSFRATDNPLPENSDSLVVVFANDFIQEKEALLETEVLQAEPEPDATVQRVAVWLYGNGAGLSNLAIEGSAMVDTGILICHGQFPVWVADTLVENVKVSGIEGKRGENRAIHLKNALRARINGNELWGGAPLYFSGARLCEIRGNRIVPMTRFGGNAEGAIQSRQSILDRSIIADNVIANAPGKRGGIGSARRMIWLSTGLGSVSNNYIAGNTTEDGRFLAIPGTDQNVGENILFEACQRYIFFGRPAGADDMSVILPEYISPTPGEHLGCVKRFALAYDEYGRETPALPPLPEDSDRIRVWHHGIEEGPADEYFVMVVEGHGMGQTRRIAARDGHRLLLDSPWRTIPDERSRILITTLFYRNLIVGNATREGMSGIQLWLTCVENIVADNDIRHHRGGGISVFGTRTTEASSKPRQWNRGLAPNYFNIFEGNTVRDSSGGAIISGGASSEMPNTFPLSIGNILRHNSLYELRGTGVSIGDRRRKQTQDKTPSVVGTIVEFNIVRNADETAFSIGSMADFVVVRRNIANFQAPPSQSDAQVAISLEDPGTYAFEHNVSQANYPGRVRQIHLLRRYEDGAAKKQLAAEADDAAKPQWRTLARMPQARFNHAITTNDELIYVIGGASEEVDIFDPLFSFRLTHSGRWALPATHMSESRSRFAAVTLDDKFFCIGGAVPSGTDGSRSSYLASLHIFDPIVNRWRAGASLMEPRAGLAAAELDGKIYAVGGCTNRQKSSNRVEIYDPATNRWSLGLELPEGRTAAGVAAVDGRLYVIGGKAGDEQASSEVFIFDPKTSKWTRGTPMPVARHDFTTVVLHNKIWSIGGITKQGLTAAVTVYDPYQDEWSEFTPLPRARAGAAAVELRGRIYVSGGYDFAPSTDSAHRPSNEFLELNPGYWPSR